MLGEGRGVASRAATQGAFNLIRAHARRTNRKVVDVAEAIVASHQVLPSTSPAHRDYEEAPVGDERDSE